MSRAEISWSEFEKLRNGDAKFFRFTVVTGSMEPIIPVGGKVVVEVGAAYHAGDIVVFWQNEKLICHIFWRQNKFITDEGRPILVTRPLQGGAWDVSIRSENILGKVINHRVPTWRLWLMRWRDRKRS